METQMKLEHEINLRWLLLFALPTIFSSIFSSLYTTVDGVWMSLAAGEILSLTMSIYYFLKYRAMWQSPKSAA